MSIKISLYVKVVCGVDSVAIHNDSSGLLFLGASTEASVAPGYDGAAPFTLAAPKVDEEGLMAITSTHGSLLPFFVRYGWKDDKPYVFAQESDRPWVPPADVMLQITKNGKALEFKIGDEYFTTDKESKSKEVLPVSAGNLICRYAISTGEEKTRLAEEIKDLAVAHEEEKTAKETLCVLQEEMKHLSGELEDEKLRTAVLAEDRDRYKQQVITQKKMLQEYTELSTFSEASIGELTVTGMQLEQLLKELKSYIDTRKFLGPRLNHVGQMIEDGLKLIHKKK